MRHSIGPGEFGKFLLWLLCTVLVWLPVKSAAETYGLTYPILVHDKHKVVAWVLGTPVRELPAEGRTGQSRALYFIAGMSIDADGAVHAYHPMDGWLEEWDKRNKKRTATDPKKLAQRPYLFHWGLDKPAYGEGGGALRDKKNQRRTQDKPGLPGFGYYLSPTALYDKRYPEDDPRRYVDALNVPYVVLSPAIMAPALKGGARMGDFCLVTNNRTGIQVFAVAADVGPVDHLGEGSIELARRLGIENTSPRDGGAPPGSITYVVFPQSGKGNGYIPSNREIQEQGQNLVRGWQGADNLGKKIARGNRQACSQRIPEYEKACRKIYDYCCERNCATHLFNCKTECGSCGTDPIYRTFDDNWCKLHPAYLEMAERALADFVAQSKVCVDKFLKGELKEPFFNDQKVGFCIQKQQRNWENNWKQAVKSACKAHCSEENRRAVVASNFGSCKCE